MGSEHQLPVNGLQHLKNILVCKRSAVKVPAQVVVLFGDGWHLGCRQLVSL
jgi:hypothetical protein